VLGSVLWGVATAAPVAVSAFLIYEKQRSLAGAAPPATREPAAAVAADEAAPGGRVAVAPLYADPELLKRKTQQDALLRPRYESARRQAEAREAMATQGGRALAPTGNSRPSAVGPAPEPPENPFPPTLNGPPSAAAPSSGPRFYGLPEDASHATPPPPAPRSRRR
jgi:hypothetical protein